MALLSAGCPADPDGDAGPTDDASDLTGSTDPTDASDGVTDTDTDTTPPETGETGDTGAVYVPPTLGAACSPTANPLRFTCHVTVDPPQPVQVRFAKSDGSGLARTHTSDAAVAEHDVPLYLMAGDTDYDWTAELLGRDPSDTAAVQVAGTLTTGVPEVDAMTWIDVEGVSSVPYVGTHQPCNDEAIAVIYDTVTGELLWYHELDPNGTLGFFDMIRFTEDHTVLGETGPSIAEVDLAGNDVVRFVRDVDYSGFLHHDVTKHDGYIYALFQDTGTPTLDGFDVFDGAGLVASWYARDTLYIPGNAFGDWMHTNTIFVDDNGDVVLSSWGQDTVLKIAGDWNQPDFGQQIWAMDGDGGGGFGDDYDIDWSGVDGSDAFRDQHDVHFMSDGRLLMLDNGHGRGLVLTVDQVGLTATADATYPTVQSACGPQGTAAEAAGGNVMVGCSGNDLLEYTPGNPEPVWSAETQCLGGSGGASVVRWYALDGW